MTTVFVQFTGDDETAITAVFSGPQDSDHYPNQASIDDSDKRYQAFISTQEPSTSDEIASARYEHETSGITVSGVSIETDRDSQTLITSAALGSLIDSSYVCNWKTVDGFVSLTSTQLIAIATAVRAHVQSCFDRESVLLSALANGSYTESMLSEGWPT